MNRPILYLDTNHISALARSPESPAALVVLRALGEDRFRLGLSLPHLVELSHPAFVDRPAVGALLDQLPLAWCVHLDDLLDREIDSVLDGALGFGAPPVAVFWPDPIAAWGMPPSAFVAPSEMLAALAGRPDIAGSVRKEAQKAADLDAHIKKDAAAVRRPLEPLAAAIRDRAASKATRARWPALALTPEELIGRAGGLAAFPSQQVFQLMGVSRHNDTRYESTPNDVVDDIHAVYAPYAAFTVLDRATVGRFRSMKLTRHAVFARLSDLASAISAA